jgi:hypothetical protein
MKGRAKTAGSMRRCVGCAGRARRRGGARARSGSSAAGARCDPRAGCADPLFFNTLKLGMRGQKGAGGWLCEERATGAKKSQLSTVDVLVPATMKSAANCDT